MNEDSTHSFVLHLIDVRYDDEYPHNWRAILEHVNTRDRYPIFDMKPVQNLLAPYEDQLNIEGWP
ncbi:MAG: hypothetical protein AAF702_16990 [Chloroflexota bacterium]